MKGTKAFIAAFAGTFGMSLFMRLISGKGEKEFRVIRILGTILTREKTQGAERKRGPRSVISGSLLHYTIGLLFSFSYRFLFRKHILKSDLKNGILLGLPSGLIGVVGWNSIYKLHPDPPDINFRSYLKYLFFAHFLFSVLTTETYAMLKKV